MRGIAMLVVSYNLFAALVTLLLTPTHGTPSKLFVKRSPTFQSMAQFLAINGLGLGFRGPTTWQLSGGSSGQIPGKNLPKKVFNSPDSTFSDPEPNPKLVGIMRATHLTNTP